MSYRAYAGTTTAYLRIPTPVLVALDDLGGAPTAGHTGFDVDLWDGSAWNSIFPSSGTTDRRPAVAFNGAPVNRAALPEVLEIPPGSRLRCRCIAIPTAASAPIGAELVLPLEVP